MAFSTEILNHALELATEWGDSFRKPIAERMKTKFPELDDEQIAEIEALVRKAEYRIYEIAAMEETGEITENDSTLIAAREFPWMDAAHLGRLKNIGMYYARR